MQLGTVAVAVLVLTAVASGAAAQEKKIKRSDLPAAAQRTAAEQSAGAKVRGYSTETENGQVVYEVELMAHGRTRDVSIGADGAVLEIEQEVALDSLPEAVRTGLKQAAGSGKIGKVESLTKKGTLVAYEAHVRTGRKSSEVQVGPDGKPLAHPE